MANYAPRIPWLTNVALGSVEGYSFVHKFGRNPDIDTASGFETIWNGGGLYPGHNVTIAEIVEIFSSDANDSELGSGARTLEVFGLDTNYEQQSEIITLNGVTPVDTLLSYIRLDRAIVRSGAPTANIGTITIRQKVTTANVFASIPSEYGQTMLAAYTIPFGKTGLLYNWNTTLTGKTTAIVNARICIRLFGKVFTVKEEATVTGHPRHYLLPKNGLPAKSDIMLQADTTVNNTGVSGTFDILLVDDS